MTAPAEPPIVPLWEGTTPHSNGTAEHDIPALIVYLPEGYLNATTPTSALVVCPGGGYGGLAMTHEGSNIGRYFQAKGVAAFVLRYRLPAKGYRHPVPLMDVQRAIRFVRSHAAKFNIDPAKVGVMGFSAGGHLASTVDTHFDSGNALAEDVVDRQSCRPDFAVLVYPVITLKVPGVTHEGSKSNLLGPDPDPVLVENLSNETQVTTQTPPTLFVHADNDTGVPIENSRLMMAALEKAAVPTGLHQYSTGGHGFGYGAVPDNAPAGWLDKAYDWVKGHGFLP
jgi:acetyl esterase/lipase